MTKINRRTALAGGGALAATALMQAPPQAFARKDDLPLGTWTPLADMPFPVQDGAAAPFWKSPGAAASLKAGPFNIIVCAGGVTPNAQFWITDAVVYYDPKSDSWSAATPLPKPRHHAMLVNSNGYLYALGGYDGDADAGWRMRKNCWRLDAVDDQWKDMRDLPNPQAESVCVSVQGNIHLIGGRAPAGSQNLYYGDHIDTDGHWLYDPSVDGWFPLAGLTTPRHAAAAAVINGVVYVFGGRTVAGGATNVVEVYDPLSDRWEAARPMPKALSGHGAAVLGRKIYIFGGADDKPEAEDVSAGAWEYDPYKDTWRAVAAMPRPRHGLGAVAVNDVAYLIGGGARAGEDATSAMTDKFEI